MIFKEYLDKIRDILSPKPTLERKDGSKIGIDRSIDLKKGELQDFLVELEQDLQTNKNILNNIDELKKSHSDDDINGIEFNALNQIRDLSKAIKEVKEELNNLKKEYSDTIVCNSEGKILFLLRGNETDFEPGKLGLPGGHIDEGEDPETAAKRELLEETNLEATSCQYIGCYENKDVKIHYYQVQVKEEDLLILDTDEHFNYKWLHVGELIEGELIAGLKENLEKLLTPISHSIRVIKKAFELGKISEDQYLKALEKGGKVAQLSEERMMGGVKMKKTPDGWIPVGKGKSGKKEEEKKDKNKKQEPQKEQQEKSPEQLSSFAKEASTEDLQRVAEDNNSEPSLKQAAEEELGNRGVDSSPSKKLKEKAKDWHKKQIEFYQSGALDSGSEERKGLGSFLEKKKAGIIKAVKDEIHEYKEAGSGLKKFFSGNKSEITSHEKKAIKTVAIHLGVVIGSMAITGGLSGLASKGVAALGKGIAMHYFEHAGLMRLGHVLAFAKAEGELSEKEYDELMNKLLDDIIKHIESGDISEEELLKMGDQASSDFSMMQDEDEESGEGGEEESDSGRFDYDSDEGLTTDIEKGGKPAQIGEVREYSGKKMQKTASGWVPVTEGKGEKKEEVKKTKGKKEDKSEDVFSSYDSQLNELSKEETDSLINYREKTFRGINSRLRQNVDLDKTLKDEVKNIDSAIGKVELQQDTVLKRGIGSNAASFFESLKEGDTYQDKGYSSTTVSDKALDAFRGEEGSFELVINAKKGSNALPMQNLGDESLKRTYKDEKEFLLPRNSKFKVLKKEGNRIEVELI